MNMNESVMLDVRCIYKLDMKPDASAAAGDDVFSGVSVDSVVFIPDYRISSAYAAAAAENGRSKRSDVCWLVSGRASGRKNLLTGVSWWRHSDAVSVRNGDCSLNRRRKTRAGLSIRLTRLQPRAPDF